RINGFNTGGVSCKEAQRPCQLIPVSPRAIGLLVLARADDGAHVLRAPGQSVQPAPTASEVSQRKQGLRCLSSHRQNAHPSRLKAMLLFKRIEVVTQSDHII